VAFDGEPVQIGVANLSVVAQHTPATNPGKLAQDRDDASLPKLEQLETLVEAEPLADFSVTREKDKYRLSYLTYFDPATPLTKLAKPGPDGRTDPLQARIDVLTLSESLEPTLASTISFRATSQPGVSVAAGAGDANGVLMAWSALDQGEPQVFLTVVGDDGKKRAQRMLTRRKGALDEVSVAPASDGWFAAWVDERSGTADVYVSRVTKTLERRGTELKISQGLGQVTAIALLPQEGHLLLTWTEAHTSGQKRHVELYSRRLSLSDATPLAPAARLLDIPGAVKFLAATPFQTGAVLSWLEVMSEGNSVDAPGRVRFLRLDDKGASVGATSGLGSMNASPVSVTLDCPAKICHGAVTLDTGGRGEIAAFSFDPTNATVPVVVPVIRSLGTVEQNVAPVLLGEHLFAVDQVDAERARITHATLRWQ